jgi:hypothetical protein
MTFASGASLTFESGAKFNGSFSFGAGSDVIESGHLSTYQTGASITINTGVSGTGFRFDIGGSTPSIGAGPNVPTHTAVPGSMYIRANGSMSGWFVNIGGDLASSVWRAFQQGSAIG